MATTVGSPSGLTVGSHHRGTAQARWNPVRGASGYDVSVVNPATGETVHSQSVPSTQTSATISNLSQRGLYQVQVQAQPTNGQAASVNVQVPRG